MGVTETPGAGPLLDLAEELDGFDVILGNGYSTNFSAVINGAQVVAGMNRGQYYGRTSLQFDTTAQKVMSIKTDFVQPLVANVTPVASIAATLDVYRGELAAKLSHTIATSTSVVAEGDACGNLLGRTCESITGDVVGDALRAAYGADVAITNAGAMRSSLTCPTVDSSADFCPPYSGLPAPITEGQVQAILPFSNFAAVATVSGAELKAMLENGVSTVLDVAGRFPQVSGICFWYDISRAPGSRIVSAVKQGADGACDGAAVDFSAGASYVLATNDFVAAGGDGYAALDDVSLRERLDIVVSRYLADLESITPRIEGRINCLGAACPRLLESAALPLPSSSGTSGGSGGPVVRPPATGDGGLR
jgi:2',3'-cyclic-nucleotide 2'-phosphodiesterase (5'-nucleotidase family)